jgi:hypothetical protein
VAAAGDRTMIFTVDLRFQTAALRGRGIADHWRSAVTRETDSCSRARVSVRRTTDSCPNCKSAAAATAAVACSVLRQHTASWLHVGTIGEEGTLRTSPEALAIKRMWCYKNGGGFAPKAKAGQHRSQSLNIGVKRSDQQQKELWKLDVHEQQCASRCGHAQFPTEHIYIYIYIYVCIYCCTFSACPTVLPGIHDDARS